MNTKQRDRTVEAILSTALFRLNRVGSFEQYFEYIKSEWYFTVADLFMALEDGNAWSDLKLPGRLKLEMKTELLDLQYLHGNGNESFDASTAHMTLIPITRKEQWTRHYSNEHDAFFYYCLTSDSTQWEIPTGNVDITDDITKQIIYGSAMNSNRNERISDCASNSTAQSNTQTFTSSSSSTDENLDILMAVNSKILNQAVVADELEESGAIPVGVLVSSADYSHVSYNSEESNDIHTETETDEPYDDPPVSPDMPPPYDGELDSPSGISSSTPEPSLTKKSMYQPRARRDFGATHSLAQSVAF